MSQEKQEAEKLRLIAHAYRDVAAEASERQLAWADCIRLARQTVKGAYGPIELPAKWYTRLAELERMEGTTEEACEFFEESAACHERDADELDPHTGDSREE